MPTISARDEIFINADAETVYAAVADYPAINRWLPAYHCDIVGARQIDEGAIVNHRYGNPPFVMSRFTRRVERIVANERLEERYIEGDLRGTGTWTFDRVDGGTLAAYACRVSSRSWLSHTTFRLLGRQAHSMVYRPLLKALKNYCERGG